MNIRRGGSQGISMSLQYEYSSAVLVRHAQAAGREILQGSIQGEVVSGSEQHPVLGYLSMNPARFILESYILRRSLSH